MKVLTATFLAGIAVLAVSCPAYARGMNDDQRTTNENNMPVMNPDTATVKDMTANWPVKIRETIVKTEDRYGSPSSITAHDVTWHNEDMSNSKLSPFKMVRIKDTETPHNFPVTHTDFMKHTVDYAVPSVKASELEAFDGSVTYARTRGEMSAECDTPEHNTLALNLANDIVTGKRNVGNARAKFAEVVAAEKRGEKSDYLQRLMFSPQQSGGDPDRNETVPGKMTNR